MRVSTTCRISRCPQPIIKHSMIFKTFDSNIDKWTSKIGIFGKSFNELGTAINEAFKSAIDNLNNFDENVGFWESLKNNLFSKPEDKDWLKNSLGDIISKENIDSYIKELDLNSAKNKLEEIFDWQEDVKNGETTWEKFFDTCKGGNEYLIDLIKNTDDLSKLTGEDLVKANQQARASALAHNEAIKAQTLSAKAGKVALQALATAGNMLVAWGITKGLELAVKGINNLIHSAEHCKERVDEVMSSYQSTTSSLRENAKEISSLSGRYDQLSKGVGNLGNNISLTEDEFEEYHNITSKIAETYPDLVDGWDAQGNAIVNLTDSMKELNAEYEKSLHNANLTLMESKDDIFKNYENIINDITKQIEYAEKAMDIVQSKGSFYDVIYDAEGYKTSYYKAFENLGLSVDDMINGNFSTLERQLILKIQSLKDEMDKSAQDVTPLLNAYLSEDVDYQNLTDEKLKTALSTFISSLPESLVTDITENGASAGSNFVEGLVDVVKDDDSVQNAFIQLLSLDTENLSYEEAKEIIDNYISIIVNALNSIGYNIDPIELQVELGLDIKNVKEDLRTRLLNLASDPQNIVIQDLVIDDWVNSLTEEEAKLANSTAFDEALERQKENLDGAALSAENYSAALEDVKAQQNDIETNEAPTLLSISDTIDQLNTKLKPAFDSLQSAYQDIFTDDGKFALNSIDILSTCDTIKSKLDEMSDPEGLNLDVDYSAFEDFVRVLNNTESTEQDVEDAFDALATSITQAALSGVEDFETMKAALEDLGVVNNEMVAFDNLISKTNALADAGIDLANATEAEMQAFVNESVSAENAGEALALLHLKKALVNQETITTAADCQNILELAQAANIGIAYLNQLNTLMNLITQRDSAHASGDSRAVSELNRAIRDFSSNIVNNLKLDDVEVDFSPVGKGAGKAGKDAGKSYKDALKEELSDLDSVISGITGRIDDQISSINEQKSAALESIDAQKEALEEAKDAAVEALEAERDARLAVIEAQRKQIENSIKEKQKIIDGIQDEIKAMQDANEERKREIDLQKAKYELERMQNQRTKLVNYMPDTIVI